jgi:glycosyltransferase involved in cell wall biosynthesis
LASIAQQSHKNWRLVVSDDGSTDATLAIIRSFAQRHLQRVEVRSGPGRGPAANFMALAADTNIDGDNFAFCDQDDVWHPDKLSRALGMLQTVDKDTPAVYGGRTRLVSADGTPFGHAPAFCEQPGFGNALAQSIAGGNTMLFNAAAKKLFEQAGTVNVVSHDWWAYQLVIGSGGRFLYDSEPYLDYRQHEENRVGSNRGVAAQWRRFRMILDGGFARWNDINLAALRQSRHLLTPEAQARLDAYEAMRTASLPARLTAFAKSDIRRQTFTGNVALLTAIVLRKF